MKHKEQKRREGAARNEKWQALSTAEKIKSLKARRGESKRQLMKLEGA